MVYEFSSGIFPSKSTCCVDSVAGKRVSTAGGFAGDAGIDSDWGDRPNQEKDKSFYWHKTPESSSLCHRSFVIGGTAAVFLGSLLLETVSGIDAILRGSVN